MIDKGTVKFRLENDKADMINSTIKHVHKALTEKGYSPTAQIVGYILSGDPSYITSHNNARSMICKIERDEILEELLKGYLDD